MIIGLVDITAATVEFTNSAASVVAFMSAKVTVNPAPAEEQCPIKLSLSEEQLSAASVQSSTKRRTSSDGLSHSGLQNRGKPKRWSDAHTQKIKRIPRGRKIDPNRLSPTDSDDSTSHHRVQVNVSVNPFIVPSIVIKETALEGVLVDQQNELTVGSMPLKINTPLASTTQRPSKPGIPASGPESISPSPRSKKPSLTAEHITVDNANDARLPLPFSPDCDTVAVPKTCPDEAGGTLEEQIWYPGKPLRVVYVTWNMAGHTPNINQVASTCILPNGHIIVVGTQENGPYIGSNKYQKNWELLVETVCLENQYVNLGREHLWASHIMVFARKKDVAFYFSHVHVAKVPCGFLGLGGNKGAVAVAFSLNLKPNEVLTRSVLSTDAGTSSAGRPSSASQDRPLSSCGSRDQGRNHFTEDQEGLISTPSESPEAPAREPRQVQPPDIVSTDSQSHSYVDQNTEALAYSLTDTPCLTFLCVNAHFPAHQDAVVDRNNSYTKIIRQLKVGGRGKFHRFPWGFRGRDSSRRTGSAASSVVERKFWDATDDFDVTLFGGDLNYRINGTQKAIERIAKTRSFRAVLSANDQLNVEKSRGKIFQGFSEGELRFRPTYKYAISREMPPNPQEYQNKKARMPAYCDRVLFKSRDPSRAEDITLHMYTDVQEVTTSDHRPVVAIIDINTTSFGSSMLSPRAQLRTDGGAE